MTTDAMKEKMICLAEDINKVADKSTRETMIDSFLADLHKHFDNESTRYEDGAVCVDYVNWDANCGCVIVRASIDLETVADYMIENNMEPTLDNAGYTLNDICERSEDWYDVINEDEQLIYIGYLVELMGIKNESVGEAEFLKDYEEYIKCLRR